MRRIRSVLLPLLLAGCSGVSDSAAGPWLSAETLFQDATTIAERVWYDGPAGRAVGLLCRPRGAGPYPVAVVNHGGWSGLGGEWNLATSSCVGLARAGLVAMEASYRGEDGSAGAIELCLGEADDVVAMLSRVRAQPYADGQRVLMLGGSHGGCVTVRALERGVAVRRAVALNAPADLAALHANASAQVAAGATGERLAFFNSLLALMESLYGGPPSARPAEYARHSTLEAAGALAASPVPLLLQHGAQDDVVPVAHSCRTAAAAGGFAAYHVGTDGAVIAAAPAGCAGLPIAWRSDPLPAAWPGSRYLVVYEGLDHGTGVSQARMEADMLRFLGVMSRVGHKSASLLSLQPSSAARILPG